MNKRILIAVIVSLVLIFALILWWDFNMGIQCAPCPMYDEPICDGYLHWYLPEGPCPCQEAMCFESFDSSSWEYVIDDSCNKFSDGCNTCTRSWNGNIACTERACPSYEIPKCLD